MDIVQREASTLSRPAQVGKISLEDLACHALFTITVWFQQIAGVAWGVVARVDRTLLGNGTL